MEISISKHFQGIADFFKPRIQFPDEKELPVKVKNFLHVLECRGWQNHGDTKIYQRTLAETFQVTERTIGNWLALLQEKGFITRIFRRKKDHRNKAKTSRNGFYTLRVIRCNRIFLITGCDQIDPKWKTDPRPQPDEKAKKFIDVPLEYKLHDRTVDMGWHNGERVILKRPWGEYIDAYQMKILSGEMMDRLRAWEDLREMGDPLAMKLMGYPKTKRQIKYEQSLSN